jgi:CsoR family transcriptional regulator, copper-sensing transcriptional repressor
MPPGYSSNHANHQADHVARLKRIEGQVRGLQRMVEEEAYCIDVLTQVASVTKALQSVAVRLLEDHLHHCVSNAVAAGGSEGAAKITEATKAIERLLKS